jgi:hypothetical protein
MKQQKIAHYESLIKAFQEELAYRIANNYKVNQKWVVSYEQKINGWKRSIAGLKAGA